MDKLILALTFKHYNKAKGAGKRGQLETGRVNRALGLLLSGKIDTKRSEYACTSGRCLCPDAVQRGSICKHRIAEMIISRVYEDMQQLLEGDQQHELFYIMKLPV